MKENSVSFNKRYFMKQYTGLPSQVFDAMKRWYASIIRLVIKHFNLGLKCGYALDIGCGYGYSSALLSSFGFISVGCDVSRYVVSVAKRLVPDVSFVVCDARHLPFRDKCFKLCTEFEILEHLEQPQSSLKESHRVLDEGGYLIATSHNPYCIFYKFPFYTKLIYASAYHDPTHISLHSPAGWRELMSSSSFSMFAVNSISYVPFVHRFMRNLTMVLTPDTLGHTNLIVAVK